MIYDTISRKALSRFATITLAEDILRLPRAGAADPLPVCACCHSPREGAEARA